MIVIKKALAKVAQATTLLDLLHKRLSAFEEARSHHQIHISDMSEGFCAREYALLDLTKKKPKGQFVNTPMRVAFDNGMALHDLCRNKWLKDDVVGAWHCRVCHHVVHFCKRPVEACSKCHKKLWEYKEEEFRDPENPLITGSIDFLAHQLKVQHRTDAMLGTAGEGAHRS